MWKEFGEFHFDRGTCTFRSEPGRPSSEAGEPIRRQPLPAGGLPEVGKLDGSKVFLEKDSWILFRQSGTEPLLRVYCEAPTADAVQRDHGRGAEIGGTIRPPVSDT